MYAKSYVLAKIILSLYANFPEAEVDKWLADAEVIECTEDKVILYSPSLDSLKILQEVCYSYILDVVKNLLQCNALLEIWGPTDLDQHRQNQSTRSNYTSANYSFSNYIVGTSNEIAVIAARAVSSAPGNAIYNPLYFYGPSGVGKTHLLHAIANEIHVTNPEASICYVLTDTFVSELVWSLRSGRYDSFRLKYRSADVLIVDDIQFLAGKASTQEEFYYIFDYLYQNGKQLIFSSNNYPSSIPGMENYLCSKFEQGVVLCIDTPDIKIRQDLIARLAHAYRLDISNMSVRFIAEAFPDNLRKIIGAMKMLRAAHDLHGTELSDYNVQLIVSP